MGILVANIADEDFLSAIPTLEVASGQLQQVRRWRIGEHSDVFFSNVADRLVVGAVKSVSQYRLDETRGWVI